MTVQRMVDGILYQYGTDMSLYRVEKNNTVLVRGFFQPVRSKSRQDAAYVATPLGEITRGQYVYIGPVTIQPTEGDTVTVGKKSYYFRRVEPYFYQNEQIYVWGLCVEKGVNDTWESRS